MTAAIPSRLAILAAAVTLLAALLLLTAQHVAAQTPDGNGTGHTGSLDAPPGPDTIIAVGAEPRATTGVSAAGGSIEVSGRYLGVMRLEQFARVPTADGDKAYLRGNRSGNGLWSDGATLWVADGMSSQARLRKLGCPTNAATSSDGCGVELGPAVPTGSRLTDNDQTLYFDTIPALTAYDLGGGYRIPSRDLANTSIYAYEDSGNGANPGGGGARDGLVKPDGVWSDGDVVWVSDVSRVVKAYRMSSFAEKSGPEAVAELLSDRSLTMPARSVPRGIWSDGTTIWVVDAFRDERVGVNRRPKLVAFDLASGTRNSDRDITGLNGTPEGVWSDGVTMWVSTTSDPGRDKVLAYELSLEGGEAVRDEDRDLRLRNHRQATGLWSDGERMWVADGGPAVHVYCLDRAASCHGAQKRSTDATIALPYTAGNFDLSSDNANPGATWSDDTTLWALDATDQKIYAYALSDGTAETAVLTLATDNADPAGMWSDGTTIWVSDSADDQLYAYTMDPWLQDSGSDFSLTGLNAAADSLRGVWSNGAGTIWVAHRSTDGSGRATAFNTGDGALDTDRTFDLSALNSNPAGMWSDGRTMWVLDTGADKVFAYDLDAGRSLPHRDVDALIARFEQISDNAPTAVVGIGSPTGFHVGESGSGGPRRWPRTLPPECYETHAETDADGNIVEPDPPISPPPPCDRPYGRMMWVVDGQNNKVHAVRLHPDLFDPVSGADFTPVRASVRATGPRELTVRWQPPAVGSAGLSGWLLQWRLVADSAWTDVDIDDPSVRSHTLANLTAGSEYETRVLAVYANGDRSSLSDAATGTAVDRPGQVTGVRVTPDPGLLAVSWTAPSDGGSAITSYEVQYKLASAADSAYATVSRADPVARTEMITGLADDTRYAVRVRAVNAAGEGDWSAAVTAAPGEQTVLTNAVVAADSSGTYKLIRLTFNRDLDTVSAPAVVAFRVTVNAGPDVTPAGVAVDADATTTVVLTMASQIAAGVPVKVAYTDPNPGDDASGVLQSAQGGIDALTFEDEIVLNRPGAPTGLTLVPGDGAISADWVAPTAIGGSAITAYEVQYKAASAAAYTAVSRSDVDALTETISSLSNDTQYTVRVRAVNAVGNSPWSGAVSARPETAPAATGAVVDIGNPDQIVLTYDKALDTASVPAVDAFAVEVDGVSTAPSGVVIPDVNTVTLTMAAEIAAGATVTVDYMVPAANQLVRPTGQAAPPLTDHAVLNRPAAPAVTLTPGDQQVTASWDAPANGGSAVTEYVVQYRLASAADSGYTAVSRSDVDALTETISSLSNDTQYTVRVRAVNDAGNGPWSVAVSARPETAPAVTGAAVDTGNLDQIVLTYDKALDTASVPAAGAFAVEVDGVSTAPSGVGIPDVNTVTLTMAAEIAAGATVTVDYTVPAANQLVRPTGQAAPPLTGHAVLNRPAAPAVTLVPAAGQITASWDAPAAGGSAITAYEVEYKAGADSGYTTVTRADAAATSETIASLVDGTSYTVRVRATNAVGNSPWGEAATIAGDAYPAPGGPYLFTAGRGTETTAGDLLVRWLPPTSAATDADLQGWEIQWRSGSEDWSADRQRYVERDRDDGGLSFEARFGNVTFDTEYGVRVRARVTGRASVWTDAVTVTVTRSDAPDNMDAGQAAFKDPDEELSEDTVSSYVIFRVHDSLERAVNDEGLVELKVVRSLWMESYYRDETVPITGAILRFGADSMKCNRWGQEGDGFEDNRDIDLEILHPGAAKVDWEHVGWSGNQYEIAQRNFNCYYQYRGILPRNAEAAALNFVTTPGTGTFVMEDPDPDVATLSGAVAGNGALTIRWQQEMWAGARVLADFRQEGFEGRTLPKTEHRPAIQWVPADQEFEDDLSSAVSGGAARYLVGSELKTALLAGEYTITGLDNGTAYKVRFVYGDDSEGVQDHLTSNVVMGTPELVEPVPESAAVSEDGETIAIVFDQDLDTTGSAPAAAAFAVTVGAEAAVNPDSVAFHATEATTITLNMATDDTIAAGETVSVAYTKPSANVIQNSDDQQTMDFSLSAPNRPAAPGAPTLTPGAGTLDVVWTAPTADGGSEVTGYDVQWKTADQTWAEAATAGQTDGAAASPYTITGLAPVAHAVRVIAVNAAGSGPPSPEETATPTAGTPTITGVEVTSSPQADASNDTYGLGEDIEITVTFSEAVTVTGDVAFGFSVAGEREARLKSGNGTTELVFAYTVQADDDDDNGIWIGEHDHATNPTFDLEAGQSIASIYSNLEADLDHGSLDTQTDHKVDGSLTGADATLSALSLSGITLDQTFTAGAAGTAVTSFTATTTVTSTTVTATASQSGGSSAVVIDPADADVTLELGDTVITVEVTSTNGDSTRAYTVTVTREAVTDTTAPTVSSAQVSQDGTTIDIVFDEDLDRSSTVAAGEFAVTVGTASAVNPSDAELSDTDADTVVLTMGTAVAAGETVSVDYTAPATGGLQDGSNNTVATFTGQAAANRPAAPVVILTAGDGKLTASWSAPANGGSDITAYAVEYKEASAAAADYTAVSRSDADALTETISSLSNDTEYTVRVRAANASGDGPWAEKSATPMAADTTAPSGSSATVSADGMTIDVVFDEDLDRSGSAPAASAFEVTVDGGTSVTPDSVDFHASDADTFTLTMAAADAIAAGATVTVGYDKPEDNPLKDAAGNEVGTFTGQAAANRLDAPAAVRAYAGNGRVDVEWDAPASGDAPSGYRVQWKAPSDGAYDATRSATVVASVAEYAITGLTNGDSYVVAVRALDDSNNLDNEAAESPEVTVGQPKAVADLTAAGRHKDFRVDWYAPDERGVGFAQDADGDPVLVYRVSWMQASETAQVRCLTATAANRFKDGTSNPGDGDTYQIKVEARFETDPAVDESVTGCADQTGFGPESSTSATVGRATTGDSDHAALVAGLEAAVTVREQQQPWMRTAWEQLKTAPFLGVQAKDRDRDDYGVFHSRDCTLSSETFETDALDSCESGKFQVDVDWDLMPGEEFEYILARELGQTWFYNTGIHDAQSRSPVGRALLYFSQQDFKGDDSKHIVCTFDAMADVIAHVAVGTPSTALGSYGAACFTDGRTEPAQLTEEVVLHALHPSGTDPDGNDTTSSWFTDTYATGAEAWAAVESITPREQKDPPDPLIFPWSRGMVVILLQDEFGGYCSALVANGAAFGTAFFDNVGGGNDVTDPWNTFGCEPGAPTGVTVSAPNSQKIIDVAWTAPTKSGAPITDYTVQWRTTTQTWAQASSQTIDASPPEHQISVNPSERYVVRVRGVNSIGDGEWGAEVTSDAADDDANLTALSVDGTGVEDFDKDTTGYSLNVAGTVARVTFVAAASDGDATVAYTVADASAADADSVTDGHQVDLDGGSNEVVITVTAQDGTTTKAYTVTVHRAAVPHDWSLRPDGVPIGGMFRLLFVTSATRDGRGTDIGPYDGHVRSALAADAAHEDIRDYSPQFKALAGTRDGPEPRTHTGTHPVDDGVGVAIWWLNGPLAAADNDDFYEYDRATSSFCSRADDDPCYDGWRHSNPVRVESGAEKTFHRGNETDRDVTKYTDWYVWTGTDSNGARESSAHLGSVSGGLEASAFGQPFDNESVWSLAVGTSSSDFSQPHAIDGNEVLLGLYGLSDILYLEPPDAPYATVAAITSTPANSGVYRAGETITATVTFSEAVAVDTTSGTPSLRLGVGSNTRDADYQSIDSTGIVLTFAYPVVGGDEDLDGIAVAMGALKLNGGAITGTTGDHNGVAAVLTHAAITADENQKVDGDLDAIAPSVDSATVSTDGTTIDIVFDEDLDRSGSEPAALAFQVTVGTASAVNPSSVDFHATAATTVVLTMGTAIAAGETVSVAYTKPASNALADAASNEVESLTGQAALNRPAAPVVSLTAGDEKLTASWAAPANGGSAITGYDVQWKTAAQTWDEAETAGQSDTAAATATTHEITGLTNDTEYTVRARAANDAGDGPWSAEASETPVSGSSDADLSALTVDDGTGAASVDGFDPADTGYSLSVAGMVARMTVAATASHGKATVEIVPADADAGTEGHQVDLAGGPNVVTITVTAEDTTTKDYTVTVHRAAVPHDWSLRPEGVPAGELFRVLIVTSTEREATSSDIADYDAHVRSALANRGHADIVDYGPLFKALAATKDGAHPRSHTGTDPDVDGPGEEIWWLNGPKAADDYADFYDYDSVNGSDCDRGDDCFDGWNHSNPARTASGDPKTFYLVDDTSEDIEDRVVWTGTWLNGRRSTGDTRSLGTTTEVSGQRFAFVGGPYQKDTVWVIPTEENAAHALVTSNSLGLYGLSDTLYVEPPDSPYATVAAVISAPENGNSYTTGEYITVTVTFSEAVEVDITSGTPRLPLRIGSDTRYATYQPDDSTATELLFDYLVVPDDRDLDGLTVDKFALELNGGTITGTTGANAGVDAALTHTGVLADENRKVNPHPVITGVEVTSTPQATNANDTYGLGEDIEITVTFSEAVTVTGDVDFGLSVSGVRRAPLVRGDGTTELVFAYTVQATDDDDNGIWIGDHTHATIPTFDLASDQSIMGAVSGLDALLEHDEVGQQNDHKVGGSLTGADATLSALSLSGITLVPAFAPGATTYTATTSLSSTTVTISISQGQNGATGRIAAPPDADLNESGHQVTLDVGDTTITVTVTSSNGDSTRTYTITVTREVVTDTTAPEVDSAQVVAGQLLDEVHIFFDEDLDYTGSKPAALAFQVTIDGTTVNPNYVGFHATDTKGFALGLLSTDRIAAGAIVTVDYTKPTANALADAASNEVESFTGQAVPNRPAAPVVTLSAGDGKLTATWTAPANGGSAITGYDVEWKTGSQTWAQAATAGQSATATSPHEITGLTNDTEYTVRVRAANDAGDGPWSAEASETPFSPPDAPGGLNAQVTYREVELSWNDPNNSDIESYQYRVSDDGGNNWDPDWTEIDGSGASTTSLTLSDLDHRTEYTFGVRAVVAGVSGEAASVTATPAATGVPHDWDLRPPGIATGETFRLLIVTSTWRNGESGDVDDYNDHVQDAVASGHADIQEYSSDFRVLVGTEDGASPRDNTHSNPGSDGDGEQIWWLNGPRAANDYDDLYDDDGWDHTNPVRTESGGSLTYYHDDDESQSAWERFVWTGARRDGSRAGRGHLGTTQANRAFVGVPYFMNDPIRHEVYARTLNATLRLYGLSPVFRVEAPDAPYATTAAITTEPANGTDYRAGEVVKATVTFSEDVTVAGTPQLPLRIGDEERDADYAAGDSSSTVLSFSYLVTADDTDRDGISIDAFALKLNGGSIKRKDTNVDAALTHTRVLADDEQRVNLRPLITGVEVTSSPKADASNDTYGLGEDIEITVTFSEAVNVTGDVAFGFGVSGQREARLKSGNGTTELVFAYTVQSTDDDDDGIWIGDHTHATNPTFDLEAGQSVVGAVTGLDALLEHDKLETLEDHKVDGSLTGADATLSALSLSGITLDQTFTAGAAGTAVTSFTATTSLSSTVVTATASQSGGSSAVSIDPGDADANTTDHEVNLSLGDTVITVEVTSTNGDATRTYTVTVTRQAATDTTAPSASSAQVSTDGMSIDIVFDEDLDATGSAPAALAFQVTVGTASAVNPSSVDFHATTATTVVLTMGTAIAAGETVSVAYTKPSANALADAASNEVESFTGQAALNRPAAPAVTLSAGDGKLTASWAAPANGGSAITGYDVEWKTAAQTWDEAATAGQSDTATSPHEITGLTNDTEYTVRVRASNAAGDGPWSAEASETPAAAGITVSWSAASYAALEGHPGTTVTLALSAAPTGDVTVMISFELGGGAEDADYSGAPTSVTFDSASALDADGRPTESFVVVATDDGVVDPGETVTLSFGTPLPSDVTAGTQGTAAVSLVDNDIPFNSSLVPDGTAIGDGLRLLFVTSGKRNATSADIADYNDFVQRAAASGHADIQDYSGQFQALASTASRTVDGVDIPGVDARDNTATNPDEDGTGVPIWWLNGPRAANDYADLYDDTWDHQDPGRNQTGAEVDFDDFDNVWTGTDKDGTARRPLGGSQPATFGRPPESEGALFYGFSDVAFRQPLYALSYVLYAAAPVDTPYVTGVEAVDPPRSAYRSGDTIRLEVTFSEDVTVSGEPTFPLSIGNDTRQAQYQDTESTSTVLVFTHLVTDDDYDNDTRGISNAELELVLPTNTSITRHGDNSVAAYPGSIVWEPGLKVNSPPKLTGIEITSTPEAATNTYGLGEDIEFTVTFDVEVTVTGDVTLGFFLGGVQFTSDGRQASLTSGDGAARLVFTYTVESRDSDNVGIWVGESGDVFDDPFTLLSGQSITGPLGSSANLAQPGLDRDPNHLVDGSRTGADARLSNLSLDGVTLVPAFAAGVRSYTASADAAVDSTTVTAAAVQSSADVDIDPDDDDNATGHQVDLVAGATTRITVTVTAPNDATVRVYTIDVTREAATDTTAPAVSSAQVSADGTSIAVVFNEDLDATGSAPAATAFQVTVGTASAVNPAGVAFHATDANTITLTMESASPIAAGKTVTVAYTKPTANALKDAAGNEVESFTGTDALTAANRPLAIVGPGGEMVGIMLDRNLAADTPEPAASAFTVTVGGGTPVSPASVALHPTLASLVELTMGSADTIPGGAEVTVAYTAPASGGLRYGDGNEVESFTVAAVNRIDAPAEVRAYAGNQRIDLAWDPPASGASPSGYRVEWKAPSDSSYVTTNRANVAANVTLYAITGLTNGDPYVVRVRPLDSSHALLTDAGDAAEAAEVTVGRPKAVVNLTVAGRHEDFRVSWDAPVERGVGFLQDQDAGEPVLVYRITWKKQGQSQDLAQYQAICRDGRQKTAVNGWFEIASVSPPNDFNTEYPQDGDTYEFTVEARFQAGASVVTRNCRTQDGFGEDVEASATAGRATASEEDHAAVRAALAAVVYARDENWPWLRTAWDHVAGQTVQAADLDPGNEGNTGVECLTTNSPVNLGGCTFTHMTIDMDWDLLPQETFEYVAVHELAHVWTLVNDLHDGATRGPVGRAVLYFFGQEYKGSSAMMELCAAETLADALTHVAEDAASAALIYYGDQCFSDARIEPTALSEEVALYAMHPSGADPNGVDTTSSWFTDTFTGATASADAWAAVSEIESKRHRYLLLNLLQDEFSGLCPIRAANKAVFDDDSDIADPWKDGGCTPDAPTVTAESGSAPGAVDVSWTAPSNAGGAPLLGYTVQWKLAAQDWPQEGFISPAQQHVLDDPAVLSYTITGLIGGLEYTVRVRARNSIGDGVSADESVTAGSANRSTPPPPKNLRAITQKGTVELTWEAPDDATVTGYRIERQRSGEGSRDHHTLVEDTGNVDTGYTDESAETDVEYEYRVSARNEAGPGEASPWVSAGPAPVSNSPATGAPTVSGTVQVGETLTAGITGIADADGLENVTFSYQWLADGTAISGAMANTYTLVETDEDKTVKVRVSFTDDAGNAESLTSAATAPVAAKPNSSATGSPTISGTAQVGETLTADTSSIADANGLENVSFSYQWLADDADISSATGLTYTLAVADEGKAITVQVSFTDDAENAETLTSAATDEVAAAEPSEPPAKPTGLSATATHDQVVLTWDDSQDDSITGYVILRRVRENDEGGEFSELVADTGTAATTYTDDSVKADTTYTYRIKAINGHGVSERSRWFHIDTPAAPVPAKPTGLSATASHDQVVLTWDDPGDDGITGYVILRRHRYDDPKGHFDELVADTGTAATTYTDDTVEASAHYTYRIKAINEYGVSVRSRWFHIDTPVAP